MWWGGKHVICCGLHLSTIQIMTGRSVHDVARSMVSTTLHEDTIIKVKVCSYIARYPVHRTAQSALHFTPWHLFIPRPSQLLWEVFSHAAIAARRLFVHISTTVCIARYSFIQLSELWQRGVIKLAKGSKRL